MENIIEIKNLSKSFGKTQAVKSLSFCVKEGETFAFLGVNGAGKSTTINIICGQLEKDGGKVFINGNDLDCGNGGIKRDIGIVFQNSVLDSALTVYDNLESRAALYGITGEAFRKRLSELSEKFELDGLLKRTVGRLSGGQRRKVDVARSLIHNPRILFLDEPTTGLDPQTRKMIWNVIYEIRQREKMTVFLTTHYMEEATDADYVIIIDGGEIAAKGTPLELKNRYVGDYVTLYGVSEADVLKMGIENYEKLRDGFRIRVQNVKEATDLIVKYPEFFSDCEIVKGKMDDVFLAATGKKLGGGEK